MPQQQIIWTALPNGRLQDNGTDALKLSVVAAPRLRLDDGGTGTLQSFPDFLDWPAHVQQSLMGFDIFIDDDEANPVAATVAAGGPPEDSDTWKALFAPDTAVRSQQFEGLQGKVSTYSVAGVAMPLQAGYQSLAGDAPFRPADKGTFRKKFADFAGGISPTVPPGARPLRERLRQLHTLPADELGGMHRELAASLLRSDPDESFDDKLAGIAAVAGALARLAPPGQLVPLVPEIEHPAGPLAQFAAFHRRAEAPAQATGGAAAPPNNDIDFHRALTALGEYPWLLRRLRLIFDLELDLSRVPKSSIGALRHIRARPRFSSAATDASTYTPVTKYILDEDLTGPLPFPVFVAAPRAAVTPPNIRTKFEIVAGFLNLGVTRPPPRAPDDLQFDIFTVDIDGAAKKVLNTMAMAATDDGSQATPIDGSNEVAAPALQTSGLNLVRTGQANLLVGDVTSARAQEDDRMAGRRAVLFAEDLVRGYRIDVRHFLPGFRRGPGGDPMPPWLSLHQRIGDFRFKRNGASDILFPGVADEGFVQPVVVQDGSGAGNTVYIHESYGHWQGWSLSVPFPADPVGLTRAESAVPAVPAGLMQVDVSIQAAPTTLPRLRFGHSYQMRVRTVDLAGNGLTLENAQRFEDDLARQGRPEVYLPLKGLQMKYQRFDPIASPVLVLREELLEGEALDVMVIRSNGPSTTTAGYAAGLNDPRYQGFNDRHIAPPKSSLRMAERHGQLDAAFGSSGQPQSVFAMCQRDAGTLNDTSIVNLHTGQPEDLPDVVRTDATGAPTTIPHGLSFIPANQAPAGPGSGYTIHYEEQLRLPYLPDPLADGAALFGLPGVKKNQSRVLAESATPGTPGTLELKQGEEQLLEPTALDQLGPITKIGFPSAAQWPELRCFRLRLDGLESADSEPPTWSEANGVRTLTVRLAPAEGAVVWMSAYPREEDVALFGLDFSWSRLGSTEGERQFLNMAEHGALAMLTPARKIVLVHAVQQPLIAPQVDADTPFAAPRFNQGETTAYLTGRFKIHGKSTEKLDLLASWSEPLQDSEAAAPTIETHVLEVPIDLRDAAAIPGGATPIGTYTKEPIDTFQFNAPANAAAARAGSFLARHEFGDTRHRRVTYSLVATTRFKEYFPARITSDTKNIVRVATFENIHVPNSARPPALEITSIVPAFLWIRRPDLTASNRSGGWLRVYLGSKWFATGEDEKVAVVGDPVGGADPLHATTAPPLPGAPRPGTLIPKVPPVTLAGQQKIYPFDAHYDAERGLWYADLAFDVAELYFPFVAFKLARFQQQSLDGFWLSPLVDAGFYQLAPDRAVTLIYNDDVADQPGKSKIDITFSGPRAPAAELTNGVHLSYGVEVTVEERAHVAAGDRRDLHLGWKPSTTIVPSVGFGPLDPDFLWIGSVLVPSIADMDRRIVIKEFEIFPPDDPPPGQAWSGEASGSARRRLVYAETIAVRSIPA